MTTHHTSEFRIDRISIGLNNLDHRNEPALAEARIEAGPFSFQAFLHGDGSVSLPRSLHDERMRTDIAIALRSRALTELHQRWKAASEYDERRLSKSAAAA